MLRYRFKNIKHETISTSSSKDELKPFFRNLQLFSKLFSRFFTYPAHYWVFNAGNVVQRRQRKSSIYISASILRFTNRAGVLRKLVLHSYAQYCNIGHRAAR